MKIVNIHEARSSLSQQVEQVERGEEIVLARAGTPVARLVPLHPSSPRVLGRWRGQVRMADDFDAALPDDELASRTGA